jgi:hypothetical protein
VICELDEMIFACGVTLNIALEGKSVPQIEALHLHRTAFEALALTKRHMSFPRISFRF